MGFTAEERSRALGGHATETSPEPSPRTEGSSRQGLTAGQRHFKAMGFTAEERSRALGSRDGDISRTITADGGIFKTGAHRGAKALQGNGIHREERSRALGSRDGDISRTITADGGIFKTGVYRGAEGLQGNGIHRGGAEQSSGVTRRKRLPHTAPGGAEEPRNKRVRPGAEERFRERDSPRERDTGSTHHRGETGKAQDSCTTGSSAF